MHVAPSIYEPQLAGLGARTCGAAALCMVYRSLGIECRQDDVWARLRISSQSRGAARTHTLAADALRQGLVALVVQVRSPWAFLTECSKAGVGVILNHRLSEHSPLGHYTVLDRIETETAWVHDPQFGPHRPLARDELLRLWQGSPGRTEIAGNVALVVGRIGEPTACAVCQSPVPAAIRCCNCQQENILQPAVALGCGDPSCLGRHWWRVYCPNCDWAESNIASNVARIRSIRIRTERFECVQAIACCGFPIFAVVKISA